MPALFSSSLDFFTCFWMILIFRVGSSFGKVDGSMSSGMAMMIFSSLGSSDTILGSSFFGIFSVSQITSSSHLPYTNSSFSTGNMEYHVSSSFCGSFLPKVASLICSSGLTPGLWEKLPAVREREEGTQPAAFDFEFSLESTLCLMSSPFQMMSSSQFS